MIKLIPSLHAINSFASFISISERYSVSSSSTVKTYFSTLPCEHKEKLQYEYIIIIHFFYYTIEGGTHVHM